MISIDPKLFDPSVISEETSRINRAIIDRLNSLAPQWETSPQVSRAARAKGKGPFPLAPLSKRAETLEINGMGGPVSIRQVAPSDGIVRGVYLHIHGGGWVLGAADAQDPMLERIADRCGLITLSVEYRLAPEEPYPAGPDDCEAAALWLVHNTKERFGTDALFIGGESAGAHLAVVTLLRLRDKHGLTPFSGANLTAGIYDLNLTPSARNWGKERLILTTPDIESFVAHLLGDDYRCGDPGSADISPIYASLHGMPPAHFSVGTLDCLLDDSLFMSSRWAQIQSDTELAVFAGGCHVFHFLPITLANKANQKIDNFLNGILDQ